MREGTTTNPGASTTAAGAPTIMLCRFTTATIIATGSVFTTVNVVQLPKVATVGVLTDLHLPPGRFLLFRRVRVPAARDRVRPLQGNSTDRYSSAAFFFFRI